MSMRRTNHWPTMARLTTESALWPSARVSVTAIASSVNDVTRLIRHTTAPSADSDNRQNHPAAETIDEPPDADRACSADQRGPEIQLSVIDATDLEIGEKRFGDQAEALRSARQGAHHGGGSHEQHEPSIVNGASGARKNHMCLW